MDPTVSYEQMMAYQAGMEHSRTFEAFKRSRDEPSSASLGGGMEGELLFSPPLRDKCGEGKKILRRPKCTRTHTGHSPPQRNRDSKRSKYFFRG